MTECTSADPEAWDAGEPRSGSREARLRDTYLELSRAAAARALGFGPFLARALAGIADAGDWYRVECKWLDAAGRNGSPGLSEVWRQRALEGGRVFGWSHPDGEGTETTLATPLHGAARPEGALLIHGDPGLHVSTSEARWLLEIGALLVALRASEAADPLHARERREAGRGQLSLMANGIAHDVNNLLVGIHGGLELAFRRTRPGAPLHQELELIESSARRAAVLSQSLLAVSGGTRGHPRAIELNGWVREVATRDLREATGQTPEFEFESGTLELTTEPSLVRTILSHLISNAVRAHGDGVPTVTLRTGKVTTLHLTGTAEPGGGGDPNAWILSPEPGAPSHVYFEVADQGEGIPADLHQRIFEPFFTCHSGRSGLGLAAVLGMVEHLSGGIRLESTPNRGTTVRVVLPDIRPPFTE